MQGDVYMLDFLFELGQVLSVLALFCGFILSLLYRDSADVVRAQQRPLSTSGSSVLRNQNDAIEAAFTTDKPEPLSSPAARLAA
jgi:hypothetical protein